MALRARILNKKELSADHFTQSLPGVKAVIEIQSHIQFTEAFFLNLAWSHQNSARVSFELLSYDQDSGLSYVVAVVRCRDDAHQKMLELCDRIMMVGENPGLLLELKPLFEEELKR